MTIVDITPDKSLMQKLGQTGYRTVEAIAELVDNSIDARLLEKTENIRVTLDFAENEISVFDDGAGMALDELKKGLTIARTTKSGDALGRFGLGMKSACSALGRAFMITTSKEDSDNDYVVQYDEDEWLNDSSRTWANFQIDERKKTRPWHGTLINISKLNVAIYPNQTTTFKKDFGIRYGSYLKHGQISLYVNTAKCEPIEPAIQNGSRRDLDIHLGKNSITGWIGLLEQRSIKGDYGIHLYKNNRLIKAYDKFGIRNHPVLARIMGELHLDHVRVNYQKTDFIKNSLEYVEAVDAFKFHPVVKSVMRILADKSPSSNAIEKVLRCTEKGMIPTKLKTRMSKSHSKILLNRAETFQVDHEPKFIVEFIDMGNGELYYLGKNLNGHTILINKNSPIFEIVGNPLFLIGMIELEAKLILNDPEKYKDFLKNRNKVWSDFVENWSSGSKKTDKKSAKTNSLKQTLLVRDLEEMHQFLNEKFEFDFQFTALSILAPFLHHAYRQMVYTIKTGKNVAEQLFDLLVNYKPDEFTIVLNPAPGDLSNALEYSKNTKLIIIRKSSDNYKDTCAEPTHAWLDLVSEMKHNNYLYYTEIDYILERLLNDSLTDRKKIESLSRHRNILPLVQKHLGDGVW